MADLDDEIERQMPGWTRVKTNNSRSSDRSPDAVTPSVEDLKRKYAADALPLANGTPDSGSDTVVLENKGKRITVEMDRSTKKIVTAQG